MIPTPATIALFILALSIAALCKRPWARRCPDCGLKRGHLARCIYCGSTDRG